MICISVSPWSLLRCPVIWETNPARSPLQPFLSFFQASMSMPVSVGRGLSQEEKIMASVIANGTNRDILLGNEVNVIIISERHHFTEERLRRAISVNQLIVTIKYTAATP